MRLAALLLLLPLALFLALASAVQAAGPEGSIEGQLVNKTPGGASVAGQTVTLKITRSDGEEERTAQTDAQGRFRFDGLATGAGYSYQLTLLYQEAEYDGDTLRLEEGKPTITVEIPVWDATASAEGIKIERYQVLMEPGDGKWLVSEYLAFNNTGDHAYIGSEAVPQLGKKATLRFSLPREAKDIAYLSGLMDCCVAQVPGGMVDTMAVLPGNKEVIYQYTLPAKGMTLVKEIYFPVDAMGVLVEGMPAQSDTLMSMGQVEVQGRSYQHLVGQALAPGQKASISLSGLPDLARQQTLLWLGLGLGVLVLGLGLGYYLTRPAPAPAGTGLERMRLLEEMASLDDQREAGSIAAEEYQKRRDRVKARLIEVGPPPS